MAVDLAPYLQRKLKRLRCLSLDVDGVLTDGKLRYTEDGGEIKVFHVHDGHGIKLLQEYDREVAIISGRQSVAVERRAQELGIDHVFLGIDDKSTALEDLVDRLNIDVNQVVHIGDDLPDLPLFELVGVSVAVNDAVREVRERADIVLSNRGGHGAVREFCDLLVSLLTR